MRTPYDSLLRLLRLYLDPSPLFWNAGAGTPLERARALAHNRRIRCILPLYAQRWGVIALACLAGIVCLDALPRVPVLVLALGFAAALSAALVNAAVYLALGVGDES